MSLEKVNCIEISLHFIFDIMPPRTKRTARKATPAIIPVVTPTVYLNPDGTVTTDRKKNKIKLMRSKLEEAFQLMNEVKEIILDLNSSEFSDVEEILQPKV